jgi:hypothetical protein
MHSRDGDMRRVGRGVPGEGAGSQNRRREMPDFGRDIGDLRMTRGRLFPPQTADTLKKPTRDIWWCPNSNVGPSPAVEAGASPGPTSPIRILPDSSLS